MIEGKPLLRRVAAVGMALLLVGAGVSLSPAGPAVGTASAEWVDCDITDPILGAAYNTIIGADSGCRWTSGSQTDVENLTATDAYANGLSLKDATDSYTATTSNWQENARTVAYSKGKIAMVNELNNGSTASVTRSEVNSSVRDYYTRMQLNILADWESKMASLMYLHNSSGTVRYQASYRDGVQTATSTSGWNLDTVEVTLENGTTTNTTVLTMDDDGDTRYLVATPTGDTNSSGYTDSVYESHGRFQIQDPDTSEWSSIFYTTDYSTNFTDGLFGDGATAYSRSRTLLVPPPQQSQQVQDNLAPYVTEVFNQYQAGEINSSDLATIDPAVIGQEASTSLNSTGYYGHASIMLASIGAAGDVNVSHNLTVIGDTSNTTLDGTLFYTADDAPANGWNTSQVYNMTNYSGTFYMAVAKDDGNATIVDLETYGEEFVINEATDTNTGETVNTTSVERYTYDSTNASALEEEIDRLRQLRQEYENQLATGGGGGWFGDLGGTQIGIIIALVGVIALLTRD